MRKLNWIMLLVALLLAWGTNVGAQQYIVEIVKNGQVVFSSPTSEIEYMTVVNRLPTPVNVDGTINNGKVTITWDAVDGATSYKVFRSPDGDSFTPIGTSSTNSFIDGSPLSGPNYYCVQALGANDAQSRQSATTLLIIDHESVDLGLSVKWATCNIGASSPSDYGYYFAWGETTPKNSYWQSNCKTYGVSLGDISGNPEYDAARANWGGSWRLPTQTELEELISQCTWTWMSQNGHCGFMATGPNGNSIFLPAAGYYYEGSFYGAETGGDYWSSTPGKSLTQSAYYIDFSRRQIKTIYYDRYYGHSIRPVTE